jgi:hypothetical protein
MLDAQRLTTLLASAACYMENFITEYRVNSLLYDNFRYMLTITEYRKLFLDKQI